ncbi:Cell division control protein 24 [Phytophthora palmivora]|uniref:Cell division control protein 24 n=1 Tax=Phytophthora palmivora TaxID=4796 RepID=A0A2P4X1U5_9STRA|nr:Cell division control protein 24 [Phytophthora palmivora]
MSSPQILEAVETPRVARRRRAGAKPSRKKVALHPGVVLFDPKEFETSNVTALTVEMLEDNQEDDQEEEDSQDNQEELQDNEDEDPDSPAAKQARLRVCVIDEICETEKSYVSDISTLLDHYIVALEDSKHRIMEDAQIAVFFNNLRHLVMLNSKLLTDLTEIKERRVSMMLQKKPSGETTTSSKRKKSVNSSVAVAVQCEADGVGAVFCRYAPLFKLYGGYAKDYEEVAALLQNFGRDTRLGFTKFLEACRERSGSSKQFESLLIMPIQRIPRYKLLLERLCELTAPEHPDAAFLTEAVDRVRAAASLINETNYQRHFKRFLTSNHVAALPKYNVSGWTPLQVLLKLPRIRRKLNSWTLLMEMRTIPSRAKDQLMLQLFGFLMKLLSHVQFAKHPFAHTIDDDITAADVER